MAGIFGRINAKLKLLVLEEAGLQIRQALPFLKYCIIRAIVFYFRYNNRA